MLRQPLVHSLLLHCLVLMPLFYLLAVRTKIQTVDFTVYEFPQAAKTIAKPIPVTPTKPQPAPELSARKVFGVPKSLAEGSEENTIAIKEGNTVATAPDNLKLLPSDAQSLPVPTDEYLVTQMPKLLSEIRIAYPAEARRKNIQGPVTMDLLIDAEGSVREVRLLAGIDAELDEAALKAAAGLRFRPAKVAEKTVAVRIRYTYRFVLER